MSWRTPNIYKLSRVSFTPEGRLNLRRDAAVLSRNHKSRLKKSFYVGGIEKKEGSLMDGIATTIGTDRAMRNEFESVSVVYCVNVCPICLKVFPAQWHRNHTKVQQLLTD